MLASHGLSVLAIAILTYFPHCRRRDGAEVPLRCNMRERMALWVTPPMLWIKAVVFPLVVALNGIGNGILRLFGINRQERSVDQYYTAEELQLVVQESEELGAIRTESGRMLQELFEFGDLIAGQVMVPRVRGSVFAPAARPIASASLLGRSPHTRYPIVENDLDHIVGMIHIKDLLRLLLRDEPISASVARPLPLVPETALLDSVLTTMREQRTQMAVVIDEHGAPPVSSRSRICSRKSSETSKRAREQTDVPGSRGTPRRPHDAAGPTGRAVRPRARTRRGGQRQRSLWLTLLGRPAETATLSATTDSCRGDRSQRPRRRAMRAVSLAG